MNSINNTARTMPRTATGATVQLRGGYLGAGRQDVATMLDLLRATLAGLDVACRPLAGAVSSR